MKKLIPGLFFLLVTGYCRAQSHTVTVYTSARQTELRMTPDAKPVFSPHAQPVETEPCIYLDPAHRFQTMIGIGGAITDASAETFAKLPESSQEQLLNAYYNADKGIGYTIARTNMNSCDFSSDTYTYVKENDNTLKTFSIAHDEQFKLPLIRKAMKTTGNKLKLFISPWSPPAWMKDNNDMLHGGHLAINYRDTWANYFVKYIRALEKTGIPVWGLTVQNEPMAKQRWESCIFTAEEERDFIKNNLGPTLSKNGMGNKKLIAWDHNRDLLFQRASVILNDPAAAKYVWGIGYHWYETWTGSGMQFDNVKMVHESFPGKTLLFTEGCKEKFSMDSINNWSLGEKYAYSMLNDFNSGTAAWTDWNILLDENGGPNHVGNFCFAPIHANTKTGELLFTNAYYYIGHFSKFIRPGAQRIASASSRTWLQTTAFRNTDGSIAVVVLNTTDRQTDYQVWLNGQTAAVTSLPHSISTIVIR